MPTTIYTHDEKGHREDVHRPSAINPGDYEYIGVDEARKALKEGQKVAGPGGVCHHCGKAIVWRVHWRYLPTGDVVTFGYICTEILGMSDNRIDHEMTLLKRAAENARKEEEAKMERTERADRFRTQEPEVYTFVANLDDNESFDFLRDMKRSMEQWGSLTERQVESVKKCMAARVAFNKRKMEEAANEVVPSTELEEGRRVIEGEVVSIRRDRNDYTGGTVLKMLVKQADGNKVWGTVPKSIEDKTFDSWADDGTLLEGVELKGSKVRLTATVTRSNNDEHFGFFSRPSKAVVS